MKNKSYLISFIIRERMIYTDRKELIKQRDQALKEIEKIKAKRDQLKKLLIPEKKI